MLYVIQKGGNFVPNQVSPADIIYCVSSVQKIVEYTVDFYFTDGHAMNKLTCFYSSEHIMDVNTLVDFQAVKSKYWKDEMDLDLKRRKEAEFLIKDTVPIDSILGYICYNENSKNELMKLGVQSNQIAVRPNYYF